MNVGSVIVVGIGIASAACAFYCYLILRVPRVHPDGRREGVAPPDLSERRTALPSPRNPAGHPREISIPDVYRISSRVDGALVLSVPCDFQRDEWDEYVITFGSVRVVLDAIHELTGAYGMKLDAEDARDVAAFYADARKRGLVP